MRDLLNIGRKKTSFHEVRVDEASRGIFIAGNFISTHVGTRCVCEELSLHLLNKGWRVFESSNKRGRIMRFADMLISALKYKDDYQIASIEVYSGPAFIWAEALVWLMSVLHKPVVLSLHGGELIEFAKNNSRRISVLLKKSRAAVTPSKFLQGGLVSFGLAVRYLPNAVEVRNYEFRLRTKLTPKIVWLRAFHKVYDPELAINTLAILSRDFPEATLTMIGPDKKDGSFQSALALAERLGVKSRINITGSVSKSEVPSWLVKGDIFLNTTRFESFGVSVMEAALMGLPIVTTNIGELSFLWKNEETAMLTPPDDPEAMAGAIRRILTEPDLAARLSVNARKKAEEYDWPMILPQWENLLKDSLKP